VRSYKSLLKYIVASMVLGIACLVGFGILLKKLCHFFTREDAALS
jgi:hypothetical protein